MLVMVMPTVTLLVTIATSSNIQGVRADKEELDPIDTKTDFNNAKEREEFFQKLRETNIPLRETGLPIAEDTDDLEGITDNVYKLDARPGWPCRRRRWWGSCSTRRRTVPVLPKRVSSIRITFRRRRRRRRRHN